MDVRSDTITDASRPRTRRSLLRVLTAWEGAAIGIGVALGAGIFRTPGEVASHLSSPAMVMMVWIGGTLLVLGDCLVLAELSTRMPRAGGWYVYIEEGWGRVPAGIYGWTYTLIVDPASSAALVVILGEYLASLFGWSDGSGRAAAIAVTLGLFALSLAGIRLGGRIQDALTYAKLAALFAIAVAGFLLPASTHAAFSVPPSTSGLLAIGLALQGILWTFEGYANTTTMTEESVNPSRSLPRALVLGTAVLGVIYLLVNGAYLHVLGMEGLQKASNPGAELLSQLFGGTGRSAFLLFAILAAVGSLNGAALSAPRVTYALGRSGLAPSIFTHVTRLGTPVAATSWFAVAWCLYAMAGDFQSLLSLSVCVGALCNVAVTATLFTHRRRDARSRGRTAGEGPSRSSPDAWDGSSSRPGAKVFLAPFYPVLPLVMLTLWTAFAAAVLYDSCRRAIEGPVAGIAARVASSL